MILFLLGYIATCSWATDDIERIRIFTDREFSPNPHATIDVRTYNAGSLGKTAQALSAQLSPQPSIALQQAQHKLARDWPKIQAALKTEIEIYALLERFGIVRLPAAVINDSVVVYGLLDIDAIIARWRSSSW